MIAASRDASRRTLNLQAENRPCGRAIRPAAILYYGGCMDGSGATGPNSG